MIRPIEYQVTFEEFREACRSLAKTKRKPANRNHWVGWVIFIGLAVVLFILMQGKAARNATAAPPGVDPLDPFPALKRLAPWIVVGLAIVVLTFYWSKGQLRRIYDSHASLHRRTKLEASDAGLVFTDPVSRNELAWNAFVRFVETPTTIMVFEGDLESRIIPKRAFADEGQVAAFRELLKQNISGPVGGFEVMPSLGGQK
jgi:hypothetical protein